MQRGKNLFFNVSRAANVSSWFRLKILTYRLGWWSQRLGLVSGGERLGRAFTSRAHPCLNDLLARRATPLRQKHIRGWFLGVSLVMPLQQTYMQYENNNIANTCLHSRDVILRLLTNNNNYHKFVF